MKTGIYYMKNGGMLHEGWGYVTWRLGVCYRKAGGILHEGWGYVT